MSMSMSISISNTNPAYLSIYGCQSALLVVIQEYKSHLPLLITQCPAQGKHVHFTPDVDLISSHPERRYPELNG